MRFDADIEIFWSRMKINNRINQDCAAEHARTKEQVEHVRRSMGQLFRHALFTKEKA